MTFDDWVKDILKIEAREIIHLTPEEQKKVYFTVSADDLIKLWNAGVENGASGMRLKVINCVKSHLCKQDEDYDRAIISPKFLSDALDQMAADGFEGEIKEK